MTPNSRVEKLRRSDMAVSSGRDSMSHDYRDRTIRPSKDSSVTPTANIDDGDSVSEGSPQSIDGENYTVELQELGDKSGQKAVKIMTRGRNAQLGAESHRMQTPVRVQMVS